jgi:ribonuclease HI
VVELGLHHRKVVFASGYVEPDEDTFSTLPLINKLLTDYSSRLLVIGMDGNGAHYDWGCTSCDARGECISSIAAANNYAILNTGSLPTFEAHRNGVTCSSIVDITLVSDALAPKTSEWRRNTTACVSSDHHAVEFTITESGLRQKKDRESTFKFNNKTAKWDKFVGALHEEMESRLLTDNTIVLQLPADIDSLLQQVVDSCQSACLKSMKLRGNQREFNPFWTPELEAEKKKVIRLHHCLHETKIHGLPTAAAAKRHQEARVKYTKSIRKASALNFRNFCQRQGKEDVWSLTNRLLKDNPKAQPPSTLRLPTGYTESAEETASALLHHFYPDDTADTTYEHKYLRSRENILSKAEPEPPFTSDEVRECLKSMNPHKAPGHDALSSDIVTSFFEQFPNLTTSIMNSCLDAGYFPGAWKQAIVRILQKPGRDDYSQLGAHRPIGLLPVFGKLLEKLLIKRLTYRAQKDKSWRPEQFGFREQTTTGDALRSVVSQVHKARSRKQQVIGVTFDIKAAFDNAWWPALHERLRKTGCPSNIHRLIQSYLKDREVTLKLADAQVTKSMTKGCVQGSVCGPTFWNLILDSLLEMELPAGCTLQAYADDVFLLVTGKDSGTVEKAANEAISLIEEWGASNKLTFSASKTQAINFTPGSKNISLTMDGAKLPIVPTIKLLGVILDSQLNFTHHAKHIIQKLTKTFRRLCLFVRPTWGVNPVNVEIIYRHVIEPTVTYAAGVWGVAVERPSVRRKLRAFQRSYAIRAIRGFHTVSAVSALALAQFMPLHLKVKEVHLIEKVKETGAFDGLPDEVTLDKRLPPERQLHPANRITISPHFAHTQEDADSHASPINIFTDGSKLDTGQTGCAFVIRHPDGRQEKRHLRLHDSCTVFQAEVFAIDKALTWCLKHATTPVTIYSDSLSALNAISDRSNPAPLVVSIHDTLSRLLPRLPVSFVWVKAHVGIKGNEEADAAAKEAAVKAGAKHYSCFPLSYAKRHIRAELQGAWQQEYLDAVQGSTTRLFFKSLGSVQRFRELQQESSFEVTQVLTGHGFHMEYLTRFHIKSDSRCPCDGDSEQDISHLLLHCPHYAGLRADYVRLCSDMNVDPMDLDAGSKHPILVNSFISFVIDLIGSLKEYNHL